MVTIAARGPSNRCPQSRSARSGRRGWLAAAALAALTFAGPHPQSFAYSDSPLDLTGSTLRDGGFGCSGGGSCHGSSGQDAGTSATISGPSSLRAGQSATYTVTAQKMSLGSGKRMGMAAAASDAGTPLSESAANLTVTSGEVIHNSATAELALTNSNGRASYSFTYRMPNGAAVGSGHTLYAVIRLGPQTTGVWKHASNFVVTTAGIAPDITSAPPPGTGQVGVNYSHTFAASGTPAPTFSVTSGSLPPGITLNGTTGALTGTPNTVGTFNATVAASNGVGTPATQSFSIVVSPAALAPAITSSAAPATGKVGVPYSHTYAATGTPAPTFAVTAGALPAGLALDPATGVVSGAPTTAGTYSGTVTASNGTLPNATQAFSITITASNYQGLWWTKPPGSESGWGINFAHQGDIIFATWFTYDLDGKPWWLAMVATRVAPGVYSGELFTTTGPSFDADPFDPGEVVEATVGSATLTFTDDNDGTFAYTVNIPGNPPVTQTKSITRQVFGPLPTCVWNGASSAASATNYQAIWWRSPPGSEAGWGLPLVQQGDLIFGTWFTYDEDGRPWWLAFLANLTAPGVFSGEVFTTVGPPFNATPFDPSLVVETTIGSVTLTFTDGNTGTFAYTVHGVSQSKPITRYVFVEPGTVCQ